MVERLDSPRNETLEAPPTIPPPLYHPSLYSIVRSAAPDFDTTTCRTRRVSAFDPPSFEAYLTEEGLILNRKVPHGSSK
ncbi:MAG: hypothetical protein RL417_866 [Pseudomonadota bacterium]|jgi:hypothetical protein